MFKKLIIALSDKLHIKSIQTIITISFSFLIIIIVAVIGILSYSVTGNVVKNNTDEYVYQLVKQVNYNVEYYLKNVEYIAKNLQYTEEIQKYFNQDINNNNIDKIREQLGTIIDTRTDINCIMLVPKKGEILSDNLSNKIKDDINIREQEWYKNALTHKKVVFSQSHVQNLFVGKYDWVVSCSMVLKNPITNKDMGVLLIDINYNLIDDMVSKIKLADKGYVFILSPNGNIVYHPKQQLLYSKIKSENIPLILKSKDGNKLVYESGTKKQYTIVSSNYSKWKIVGAVYFDDIASYKPKLKRFFFIVIVLVILVSINIAVLISTNMLHPIKDILISMDKFKEGDLDVIINIKQNNEISEIAKAFNLMTVRIKELVIKNKNIERAKRKSEFKALQAQINPHFLYNTLDSIIWMSEIGDKDKVVKMTSSLAKLFRVSIGKGKEYITLKEELEHVKNYLTIQKIRYGDKLNFQFNVDDSLLDYKIIKIIIQPLVENAIYHGIKKISGQGYIIIDVESRENNILIRVSDNGVGMNKKQIANIFNNSNSNNLHLGGVGISNVNERIKLNYGNQYELRFKSEPNKGTSVEICLPKDYKKEVEQSD